MKVGIQKVVDVDVKVMKLFMKVRDEFSCVFMDDRNEAVAEYDGYVPTFMPGEHHGDYLILDIDVDTGMILNWKAPRAVELKRYINKQEEEE